MSPSLCSLFHSTGCHGDTFTTAAVPSEQFGQGFVTCSTDECVARHVDRALVFTGSLVLFPLHSPSPLTLLPVTSLLLPIQQLYSVKETPQHTEEEVGPFTKLIEAMGFTGPLKYSKWVSCGGRG